MGWKSVKEHYNVSHIVSVTDAGICIGSGFISDIIVINTNGEFVKRYADNNPDLVRYQQEMDADPEKLRQLIQAEDKFNASIRVYSWHQGEILYNWCEALGWPNVTHDGQLMYNNTFFADIEGAVRAAKEDAAYGIKGWTRSISVAETKLQELRSLLATSEQSLARLNADYPHITIEVEA